LAALLIGFVAVALSCAKGNKGVPTAVVVVTAPPASAGGATFAGAERAEALLRGAGVPFKTRDDLIPPAFPEGCGWIAAYATDNPQVILETYAFADAAGAATYARARRTQLDALDGARGGTATNGTLVLAARYSLTPANAGAQEVLSKFLTAFASGK